MNHLTRGRGRQCIKPHPPRLLKRPFVYVCVGALFQRKKCFVGIEVTGNIISFTSDLYIQSIIDIVQYDNLTAETALHVYISQLLLRFEDVMEGAARQI